MDLHTIEIEKTGLIFFDVLNGYYHEASDAAKQKKKPMVDNAVRLMKTARKVGMPIFFAKGSHREDEGTTVLLNSGERGEEQLVVRKTRGLAEKALVAIRAVRIIGAAITDETGKRERGLGLIKRFEQALLDKPRPTHGEQRNVALSVGGRREIRLRTSAGRSTSTSCR